MERVYSGKVRDVYELDGADTLLMVASDRVSAFDVIMNETVLNKGVILNALSSFFMDKTRSIVPNHLISSQPSKSEVGSDFTEAMIGRSSLVRRCEMVQVEAIVRGYLAGSAFKEYQRAGTIHAMEVPASLRLAERLPTPMFTPSIKNNVGHDENVSIDRASEIYGKALVREIERLSLALFEVGSELARNAGLILADTKFEFGMIDGELTLADEIFTPDSSRYWDASTHQAGVEPVQFDKQPLRDYLESSGWDKVPPPPPIPDAVLNSLSDRYQSAYSQITGSSVDHWLDQCKDAYDR